MVKQKLLQRNTAGDASCHPITLGVNSRKKNGGLALMSDTVRSTLLLPPSESNSQLMREVLSPKMQDSYPPGLVEKRL